ncbi:uncharacterized protein YlxW (UPF0749 family) [Crossiella equi]|uniref:Uncharacterized protein YlxW (UPF0749 family) n=1 Tax=Crossiella equi TaxID=130796 RepID=A0ABS5AH13_9PSEU|nr:DUF881 domain-containing protein [Crossiella equi]MBP2475509.1 uncharacterized protein YlxW (UPF0749 family) [Crossiella equi]
MRRLDGWRVAAPVMCLVAGLIFAVSHNVADGHDLRGGRTTELRGLVKDAESRVHDAERDLGRLRMELEGLSRNAATSDQRVGKARSAAEGLAGPAGLNPLQGPGLQVSISDAPRGPDGRYPADVPVDALVVHQKDVQSVLNALWAGGAEAMSIADQRLVASSAVRCIGNTLLLHGRTYSPPYEIKAIGDPDKLNAALDAAEGVRIFRQYAQSYGLGYRVQRPDVVRVPGYGGALRLDKAQEVVPR